MDCLKITRFQPPRQPTNDLPLGAGIIATSHFMSGARVLKVSCCQEPSQVSAILPAVNRLAASGSERLSVPSGANLASPW